MTTNKVYGIIQDKLIAQMEAGVLPWKKGWAAGFPVNYFSRKAYRGVNLLLLPAGGEFCTWNQLQRYNLELELKGETEKQAHVKKGTKTWQVVFFTTYDPDKTKKAKKEGRKPQLKKDGTEKKERVPVLRYYNVFSIQDIEGLESKTRSFEHNPIQEAEQILANFTEIPVQHYDGKQAYYSPSLDLINTPESKWFEKIELYYKTLFHEETHGTGHPSRLNRFDTGVGMAIFGSESYSFEELVAEIGAAMLCGTCGIDDSIIEDSASYISSWLEVLKKDDKMFIKAANQAQKAADYILKVENEETEETEAEACSTATA